jgi:ubiquinone/menaquinone biosynthesis C-methylase UbiE
VACFWFCAVHTIYRRFILWAFDRLYHEFAWSYDIVAAAVSRGYWPRWIRTVVPFLGGGPILELGCGTGYLQAALAQAAVPYAGLDASPQMLRRARQRLARAGLPRHLMQGRAEALPFADQMFSDVVATFPAPYIVQQTPLAEVRRVLRADGQLLIVDGGQLNGGLYRAAVDFAYHTSLQADEMDRYTPVLEAAGFAVRTHRVRVGGSNVGIISARQA